MRNFLFIPGNNPKMLTNADFLGSDAIVFDLEDAVPLSEKDAARILTKNAVETLQYQTKFGIRINAVDTEFWTSDVHDLLTLDPDFVILPKVNGPDCIHMLVSEMEQVQTADGRPITTKVIALLETAIGIEHAYEIARADSRVVALLLGAEDLTADLRALRTKKGDEILYSRSRILCAARAAGIEVYDTPFTDVEDSDGLRDDAVLAHQLGFTGKAAINPRQIAAINRAFMPTGEELDYAREVLSALEEAQKSGKGAFALHGKMIDAPIVNRAKQVLEIAAAEKA